MKGTNCGLPNNTTKPNKQRTTKGKRMVVAKNQSKLIAKNLQGTKSATRRRVRRLDKLTLSRYLTEGGGAKE